MRENKNDQRYLISYPNKTGLSFFLECVSV